MFIYLKDKIKDLRKIFWDNAIGIYVASIICAAALSLLQLILIDWDAFIYHGINEARIDPGTFLDYFIRAFEYIIYGLSAVIIGYNCLMIIFKKNKIWAKALAYFMIILSISLIYLTLFFAFGLQESLNEYIITHIAKIIAGLTVLGLFIFFISRCRFKNNVTRIIASLVILCLAILPFIPKSTFKFRSDPVVFDGGDSYIIAWTTTAKALSWVEGNINGVEDTFYDIDNAVAKVNYKYHSISIPKYDEVNNLIESFSYTINSKKFLWRSAAFYKFGKEINSRVYNFSTVPMDSESVTVGVFSDVHGQFKTAAKVMEYIGECDFYMILGDMNTATFTENKALLNVDFAGTLSRGEKLVYPVRGNHESRGSYNYFWTEYMKTPTGKQYFTVEYNGLNIIYLDTGDDHNDDIPINGGVSFYTQHTEEQVKWLNELTFDSPKWLVAASHMNFMNSFNPPNNIGAFGPPLLDMGVTLLIHGHNHRIGSRNLILPEDGNHILFPTYATGGYRTEEKEFGASKIVFTEDNIRLIQYDNHNVIRVDEVIELT